MRLRDYHAEEVKAHYVKVAQDRAPFDYSLTSTVHPIFGNILQFDKEWKTVQMKNLQRLAQRYSVSRTFGVGQDALESLTTVEKAELANGKFVGCAAALTMKKPLIRLYHISHASKVNPLNKTTNHIKPHTPAGKVNRKPRGFFLNFQFSSSSYNGKWIRKFSFRELIWSSVDQGNGGRILSQFIQKLLTVYSWNEIFCLSTHF